MGGANRKAEEVKLQKGVNLLIATPGRLIDHLEVCLKRSSAAAKLMLLALGNEGFCLPESEGSDH